ncbi:MAG: glycosyltransferase [Bacteroidota bacterium]
MKKLLINCSTINSSGPNQVALSFINECINFPYEYHVIVGPSFANVIDINNYPANFKFYFTKHRIVSGIFNFIKVRRLLHQIEKEVVPDAVFSVFGPSYWKPKAKHIQGFATPQVLYPESSFFQLIPLKQRIRWKYHRIIQLFLIKYESDAVILETSVMQKRLLHKIPHLLTYVVPNTCSASFNGRGSSSVSKESEVFRLLTLSSYKRHKNIEIIPEVIDELRKRKEDNICFYLTLPEVKFKELIPPDYLKNVINLGPLHPDVCPLAYEKVDGMFLPTLLEGFSASYPEAMHMKKPILTSNYDFATGVCGEAALYFDPLDPKSIADAIIKLKNNYNLQESLINAGQDRLLTFGSANQRAREYLKIIENYA